MHIHTRSVQHKVFQVWRSPGRFTKNPDIVALPSGRLLLIYSDTDAHWSQENQILTLLASDDGGRTWFKHREVVAHDLRRGEERLVTPRLSRLSDGRLVVLIDQDDYGHFHEEQRPGILAFWSKDNGDTWSSPQETLIKGFEPDRMLELPDGRLAVVSHLMRGASQEFAVIAHDGLHRFCEGALVLLDGGRELACVMRENHSAGIPCFVAFSQDMGRSWSAPLMLPFALHRPYAKQLADGRVLVTGRHVNGGLGTYAWCGDLRAEAGTYQAGGPRREFAAQLTEQALIIENRPGHECRYRLLPPESARSEVLMEADLKVEGATGTPVAFMAISRIGVALQIAPDWIGLGEGVDVKKPVEMTRFRRLTLHHRRGLLEVRVDGQTAMSACIFREEKPLGSFAGGGPLQGYTHWGQVGEQGRSFWHWCTYTVHNPSQPNFAWAWRAQDSRWPDDYQRRRLIQIHANSPEQQPGPDHGYSSWVQFRDGRILLVDYTNYGDEPRRAHLVGVYLEPEDIR